MIKGVTPSKICGYCNLNWSIDFLLLYSIFLTENSTASETAACSRVGREVGET